MIALISLIGCLKTTKPLTYWNGTKSEIKEFLDLPEAQSERWEIYAVEN